MEELRPKEGKSSSRQDVGGQVLSHAQGSALGCPACPGAGNLHLCNIRRSREAFLWSSATQQPDDAGLKKPWGPSGQHIAPVFTAQRQPYSDPDGDTSIHECVTRIEPSHLRNRQTQLSSHETWASPKALKGFSKMSSCCSVTKSCPTLCNPMDCRMPGLPGVPKLFPRACSNSCPLSP